MFVILLTHLEYFQGFGEMTRFRLVSGRAEAKPFCFVRYKEQDQTGLDRSARSTLDFGANTVERYT